jgi:V/A-type H+-transporting ATPase subunit K
MENVAKKLRRRITQSIIGVFSVLAITGTIFSFETFAQPHTSGESVQTTAMTTASHGSDAKAMWAFIAAAIAFGLGAIGAGLAIASVGAAAMGAVAEKPEIAGQALIFVALAEGLVVFGFIMGLLILGKI